MMLLRGMAQRTCLIVASLLLTLAGLELGFRWFRWHRLTLGEREDHPIYHHRLKPNWTFHQHAPDFDTIATTNNLGLRGPTDYGDKPPGVTRLLMLGDSFTFGVGVNDPETFCALLQQALRPHQPDLEVINAGLGGCSPLLEYLALRDVYLPLAPDAVILWFDFNDLQDDFFYERNVRMDEHGHILACDPNYFHGRFNWGWYVRERSALLKYCYNKFVRTYQKMKILGVSGYLSAKLRGERAKAAIAKLQGTQRHQTDPLNYDALLMIRNREHLPEIRKHWEQTGRNLLMIRDLLRERGIPFVLAIYPYGVQVGPDQWGQGRKAFGFEPGVTYDDPFPFEFIEAFAKTHAIPLINTYPAFLAARDRRLFHDWDGHFAPEGHQVIASYLRTDPLFQQLVTSLTHKQSTFASSPDRRHKQVSARGGLESP